MAVNQSTPHARRLSYAVIGFACLLVALSCAQALYRLWLPTEGWSYTFPDTNQLNTLFFTQNLLGEPTPIQEQDQLQLINGLPLKDGLTIGGIDDQLQPGMAARYTVLRAGQQLTFAVPLKRWTLAGVVAYKFASLGQIISYSASWVLFGLSIFVLLRRPAEPSARALVLFVAAYLCSSLALTPDGATTQYSAIYPLTTFLTYLIWAPLLAPSLLALALTFPQPKQIVRRAPWLLILPYYGFWLLLLIVGADAIAPIGFGLSGLYFVGSLIAVGHAALTQRDRVSRAQLLWGLGGFLFLLISFMPTYAVVFLKIISPGAIQFIAQGDNTSLDATISSFGPPSFQIMLAIGILRYRLFDIDVIIRRTLVYSALTVTLGAIYLIGVALLQTLFVQLTGQESTLAVAGSTLAIAGLFQPLRTRIQAVIDRRFFRRKYDAAQVLAAFARRAQQEADLDALSADMLGVVQETLEPEHARLWIIRRP